MSYVIKAAIRNAQHPEYGKVTISFPIPDEEYDHTIEQLEELDIGHALGQDCHITGFGQLVCRPQQAGGIGGQCGRAGLPRQTTG